MDEPIEVRDDGRAITIAFLRADKRNALDLPTSAALREAFASLEDEPKPIILRSATPGMFVAGTDVASLRARDTAASLGRVNARLFQRIADHPWPTVAAVDGFALGGGCELALACDLRLSTSGARWGLPEVRLGLVPSGGALERLERLVGRGMALDLVLTGRRIRGDEAARLGLVQRLGDNLDTLLEEVVDDLVAGAPLAQRLAKEAMGVSGDRDRLVDATAQALCLASDDTQRRLDDFLAR